jgi:mannobiose 2-epimerase
VRRSSSPPAGTLDAGAVAEAVGDSGRDLERLLVENVIPFWARVVDDAGGYHLHHDAEGHPLPAASKYVVGQARTLWWFSRLARSRWGTAADLDAARHGYRFLVDCCWDPTWGGFAWEVTARGELVRPEKEALAQAYGLLALTEFARAAGDASAADLAAELWRCFDAACHDDAHGGYLELRRPDWSAADDLHGCFTRDPRAKTLGVQLHVLEALTPYVAGGGSGDGDADRLRELVLLLTVTMGKTPGRPGHGRFGPDWQPAAGYGMRQYGHDVELQWMLDDGWETLGLPAAALVPLLTDTLDDVLRFGFDHRRGGFYRAGFAGRHAHQTEKDYWTQAEGLLAALRLYWRTGVARYGQCYLQTLDWIVEHQADWLHGDWHERIDRRGRPGGTKSGQWKDPYHQGRALIDCLELLPSVAGR